MCGRYFWVVEAKRDGKSSRSAVFDQSCRLGGLDHCAMVASSLLKYYWEVFLTEVLFSKYG